MNKELQELLALIKKIKIEKREIDHPMIGEDGKMYNYPGCETKIITFYSVSLPNQDQFFKSLEKWIDKYKDS